MLSTLQLRAQVTSQNDLDASHSTGRLPSMKDFKLTQQSDAQHTAIQGTSQTIAQHAIYTSQNDLDAGHSPGRTAIVACHP